MTQRLFEQAAILTALDAGATVVTAGERLARTAQWAYAEAQHAAGRGAWERPKVISWRALLAQLWSAGGVGVAEQDTALQLLSEIQTAALWESVIGDSGAGSGLLQPRAAARAAQEAWALCQSYRLDAARFAGSGHGDAEQFAVWAVGFRARCRSAHWLDPARLPQELAARIRAGTVPLPRRILFTGFHEWTPQQQEFLQALLEAGCSAERRAADPGVPENARRTTCEDGNQELRQAALWAGALLERDPATRIGIVVHDLAACGPRLRRALDDALCPSARMHAQAVRPYNLSLGQPLAAAPVIHDALLMLGLCVHPHSDYSVVSQWLRSPFMCAAESERAARLRFEIKLRDGAEQIPLQRLLALLQAQDGVGELAAAFAAVLHWRRTQPRRQSYSAWAQGLAGVLRTLGWPGERVHDSAEHQAIEALRTTLGDLAALDLLNAAHTAAEAVTQLTQLTAQQVFQPASEDTPVQVMGTLEATGLRFDHLWIAGWSDEVWPASPRPDPLIPASVQRAHDMPHASAARELEFAQALSARLLGATPDVIVSTPRREADRDLRPSPLIVGLAEVTAGELPQRAVVAYARQLYDTRPALETLDDSRGPALSPGKVRGGTGVLKSQAACPFQAFARYRLGAQSLPAPGPGLDAADRGSLLHRVLYRLYGKLTDQAAILALDDVTLAGVIHDCVDATLHAVRNDQPILYNEHFFLLERERLVLLIGDWLQQERARAPFRVAERELAAEVRIGALQLKTRIDRLDRLRAGGYALIDYKTSDVKPGAWAGERPDEPQLPCYAVTAGAEITAVLFAVLRPGATGWRGYTRQADTAPGVAAFDALKNPPDACDSWDALLAHWQTVLSRLAGDFTAGMARVAPKDRNRTCRVCDLAPLCRIDEIQALGDPPDD